MVKHPNPEVHSCRPTPIVTTMITPKMPRQAAAAAAGAPERAATPFRRPRASGRAQFSGVRPRLRRGGSNPEQGGRPEDRRGRTSCVRRDQWTDDYSRQRQECIGRRNCRTGRKHRHDRQALGCRKRVGRPGGPSCTPAAVYGAQRRLLGRGISVAHHRDRHGGHSASSQGTAKRRCHWSRQGYSRLRSCSVFGSWRPRHGRPHGGCRPT